MSVLKTFSKSFHVVIILVAITKLTTGQNCPDLPERPKQIVTSCIYPSSSSSKPCNGHFPSGTIVKYDCAKYFTPSVTARRREIVCNNGKWRRLSAYREFGCNQGCGQPSAQAFRQPLIVFGKTADRSRWPWHATLFRKNEETGKFVYICGGTLLNSPFFGEPTSVITGAHCLVDRDGLAFSPKQFKIVLGAISSKLDLNLRDKFAQVFNVASIVLSPNYDSNTQESDLAIVHLAEKVVLSDQVLPACFPYANSREFEDIIQLILSTGNVGEVVGFGVNEFGNVSESLKYAELPILSPKTCYEALDVIPNFTQLCVGYPEDGTKNPRVCRGDSGGGFVINNIYSPIKRYFVLGVVSFGRASAKGVHCQSVAIFTRLHKFSEWVARVVEMFEMYETTDPMETQNEGQNSLDNNDFPVSQSITTTSTTPLPTTSKITTTTTEVSTTIKNTIPSTIKTNSLSPFTWTTTITTTPKAPYSSQEVSSSETENDLTTCPPLNPHRGTLVSCKVVTNINSFGGKPVDCLSKRVPPKTIASFKCKNIWKSSLTGTKNGEMLCQSNGKWSQITPHNFKCIIDCGTETGYVSNMVAGKHQCPAAIGYFYEEPIGSESYKLFCHGTMIGDSQKAGVTAAFCATRYWMQDLKNRKVYAVFGKFNRIWDLNDWNSVQRRRVIDVDVHPSYRNTTTSQSDIAIIWTEPATITLQSRPMCLPKYDKSQGEYGTLIWGNPLNGDKKSFESKIAHHSPTLAIKVCKPNQPFNKFLIKLVQRHKAYCDNLRSGISTCDVGGGGCVITRNGRTGRWSIDGVVSPASIGTSSYNDCFTGTQSIFIRFSYFRDWIDAILKARDVEYHTFA